ncbi:MAG: L,D-transpeptidase family protein [Gemmatimonadetes bacterium]|nr:L,D-transpeptidase family protein [Gemmatimonadota bacterium]
MKTIVRSRPRSSRVRGTHAAIAILAVLLLTAVTASSTARQDDTATAIRSILTGSTGAMIIEGRRVVCNESLAAFYADRSYRPAWLTVSGRSRTSPLVDAVREAGAHGLDPGAYGLDAIRAAMEVEARTGDAIARARLDLLLSDVYLTLATHRATGRVQPAVLHPRWPFPRVRFDAVASLRDASGSAGVERALEAADPASPEFHRLRGALLRYQSLEAIEAWPVLPQGHMLREGAVDPAVRVLRDRLEIEERIASPSTSFAHAAAAQHSMTDPAASMRFDSTLATRVRTFQNRHGLEPDGIVGSATRAALNATPSERARQIELNLERLRWLPVLEEPRIEVRIPAFTLRAIGAGRDTLVMRVIGGQADWPTPVFGAVIGAIVLNPYWNVPDRILRAEILPAVRRDPAYLDRHDMEVVSAAGSIIAPSSIDWSRVSGASFPYRIRQRPGPGNPVGRLKFVLEPGDLAVHLHDTPFRTLFEKADRALSHGCVRVEDAIGLAAFVLSADPTWSGSATVAAIATGETRELRVTDRIPVYVLYATAWVAADGTVEFRHDVYGHDAALSRLLSHGETNTAYTFGGLTPAESDSVRTPCAVAPTNGTGE